MTLFTNENLSKTAAKVLQIFDITKLIYKIMAKFSKKFNIDTLASAFSMLQCLRTTTNGTEVAVTYFRKLAFYALCLERPGLGAYDNILRLQDDIVRMYNEINEVYLKLC